MSGVSDSDNGSAYNGGSSSIVVVGLLCGGTSRGVNNRSNIVVACRG